ncbi:unnamed protein product [Pleuronectes platessa]|uniref:Uncharacterized protein n=1 Tax=Pleuronectes platessa TaxID=8262 RepID=A0A9N7YW59_PLEPL|nr:unnamed protein product [Pleuronectes platessa]
MREPGSCLCDGKDKVGVIKKQQVRGSEEGNVWKLETRCKGPWEADFPFGEKTAPQEEKESWLMSHRGRATDNWQHPSDPEASSAGEMKMEIGSGAAFVASDPKELEEGRKHSERRGNVWS